MARRSTRVAEDVSGVREVFNNIRVSDEQRSMVPR
jgi:hypothetical protein